jgi:hypothetical protein
MRVKTDIAFFFTFLISVRAGEISLHYFCFYSLVCFSNIKCGFSFVKGFSVECLMVCLVDPVCYQ